MSDSLGHGKIPNQMISKRHPNYRLEFLVSILAVMIVSLATVGIDEIMHNLPPVVRWSIIFIFIVIFLCVWYYRFTRRQDSIDQDILAEKIKTEFVLAHLSDGALVITPEWEVVLANRNASHYIPDLPEIPIWHNTQNVHLPSELYQLVTECLNTDTVVIDEFVTTSMPMRTIKATGRLSFFS